MKADLIIADAIIDAGPTMDALTKLNIPVFAVRVASFDDITHSLRVVGALTGNKDEGDTKRRGSRPSSTVSRRRFPRPPTHLPRPRQRRPRPVHRREERLLPGRPR